MTSPGSALLAPQSLLLGRYEVLRHLATGGMGEIYLCRQQGIPGLERLVVLKTMRPELTADATLLNQFLDEARVVSTLNHPNIVSMIEVAQWEGTYVMAMEFIHGVDITTLVQAAAKLELPVPPRVVAGIIRDAAAGLAYAHRATDDSGHPLKVVHRDVSPQNLMVRPDGVVKVVDFGVAAATNRLGVTQGDIIKGTLQYMSPEQIQHEGGLDGLTDQWSLGAVAWELATGRALFYGDSPVAIFQMILNDPAPPPSTIAELPPALEAVILRMLQRDRHLRFPNCSEVVAALDAYLGETGGPAGPEVGRFVQKVAGEKLRDLAPPGLRGPEVPREISGLNPLTPPAAEPRTRTVQELAQSLPEPEKLPQKRTLELSRPVMAPVTVTRTAVGVHVPERKAPARILTLVLVMLLGGSVYVAKQEGLLDFAAPEDDLSLPAPPPPKPHRPAGSVDPEEALRRATDAMKLGDFAQAEKLLQAAAAQDPEGKAAALRKRLPDEKQAAEQVLQARQLAEQDPWNAHQMFLEVPPETLAAARALQEDRALRPKLIVELMREAKAALKKHPDQAAEKAQQVLELEPGNRAATKLLATAQKRLGRH